MVRTRADAVRELTSRGGDNQDYPKMFAAPSLVVVGGGLSYAAGDW
jgi:hypothetical protein